MKIVFFGTDLFAAEVLAFLLENKISPVAVVTQPDKPKGRTQQLLPPPVKEMLLRKGWKGEIFQPEKASHPEFVKILQGLQVDLFLVVSYGQLLKQNLLDVPKITSINIHPSLLPKYRGPSPIQSAVLQGEKEVGVTIMEMVLAMDAGAILRVEKCSLPEEMTFGEIEALLCQMAKKLIFTVLVEIQEKGMISKVPQREEEATYTKKITSQESFINWKQSFEEIHNFVRGMNPRPGARVFVEIHGKKMLLKIFRVAQGQEKGGHPGETLFFDAKRGWCVACEGGSVYIEELQLEGKNRMKISEFLKGYSFVAINPS